MFTHKSQADLIPSMFVSTAIAMIFTQLAGYGTVLIDGIITSRALGSHAYSGVSLLGPFNGILLLLSGGVSIGAQVVSSQSIGRGEKDRANASFTIAVISVIVLALVLVLLCIFLPGELFSFCGVTEASHPEIYPHMSGYLKGFMPGIVFMMLIQVIGPFIVMDSGKALFTSSAFLFGGLNIAGDWLNGYVLHGGTFGMGLATSAAYFIQFMMLLTHFMKSKSYFRLSLKGFEFSQLIEMLNAASPAFVMKFATALRDLAVNRINIHVALTTAAIAARGIQNDLNTVLFCLGLGIGKTLLTMTGMFYGADDRRGLTKLFTCAMKMAALTSGIVGVLAFLGADWIAKCFTNEPEVIELAAFSIKCMAIGILPDTLSVSFHDYLQGISERKLVNALNFADRFFIPVATALVMGIYFGSKGIMASIAVGKVILLVLLVIIVLVRTGSLRNFMLLPETFGGKESDNIYASITSTEGVMTESMRAERFCLEHGVSSSQAKLMSLFVEEAAGNIIAHGKTKRYGRISTDYRLSISGGKICLTLRDNGEHFDPSAFYAMNKNASPEEISGLKIVMGLADDVRYFNAFNSNNIMIYIDTQKGDADER